MYSLALLNEAREAATSVVIVVLEAQCFGSVDVWMRMSTNRIQVHVIAMCGPIKNCLNLKIFTGRYIIEELLRE
jgi:hypothetical protein